MFNSEARIQRTFRRKTRVAWPAAGMLCLMAVVAGCTDDFYAPGDGMRLLGHAPLEGDTCQPGPTGATPLIMDVGLAREYVFFARVENRTSEILFIESASYSFNVPNDVSFAMPVGITALASGSVPANGSAVIPVVVVDTILRDVLRNAPEFNGREEVVNVGLTVALSAQTSSGSLVESQTLRVPFTICSHCLIEHDFDVLVTGPDGEPSCDMNQAIDEVESSQPEPTCHIGQDFPVDCRICYTRFDSPIASAHVCDP